MKIKPLQIWLPRFGQSIKNPESGRDATRAHSAWRDELIVWMLPEARALVRWRVADIPNLAIPSEGFDRIDIVHVNEDGEIYSPARKDVPSTVEGLLDAWLNVHKSGRVRFVRAPEPVTVPTPYIDPEGKIGERNRTFAFGPGTYMPFDSINRETREVAVIWPPEGSPPTVSPEAESTKRYPSEKLDSDPSTVLTAQGDRALHVFLQWPEPLTFLMPVQSSADDMLAHVQMVKCARQSAYDLPGALRAAVINAHPYLSEGHSTVEHTWFRPMLERKGAGHVLFKAEERGLTIPPQLRGQWDESALNEVLKQDEWQQWLGETVPIRSAWGAIGLFWAVLIDHLEERRSFAACELCGRIIAGKDSKRFCGKNDDGQCFKRRRTVDQRRSRQSRAKPAGT